MAELGAGPKIGVVTIGRNEGERLVACLASLTPLALPIVYVDSASTDGSQEAARAAGATVVALDLTRPFTAARARNEGAEALLAQHPALTYIQFVDGDCTVEAGWVPTAALFLEAHPEVVAVCGRRRERYPQNSTYNALCDEEWDTPVGVALACGGDSLVRVDAFSAIGGFDAAMVAHEEPEMCARLRARGGTIMRIDAPMTVHDANILHLRQWWRRNLRAGFGYTQAFVRAPGTGSAEAGLLRRALVWSLLPVLALVLMAAAWPLAGLAVLLLYPVQVVRLGWRRRRAGKPPVWRGAALAVLSKFAEAAGIVRYLFERALNRRSGAILYR